MTHEHDFIFIGSDYDTLLIDGEWQDGYVEDYECECGATQKMCYTLTFTITTENGKETLTTH